MAAIMRVVQNKLVHKRTPQRPFLRVTYFRCRLVVAGNKQLLPSPRSSPSLPPVPLFPFPLPFLPFPSLSLSFPSLSLSFPSPSRSFPSPVPLLAFPVPLLTCPVPRHPWILSAASCAPPGRGVAATR
eukprot:3431909-Pleurochrysis_carterae.AAC.1